MKTETCRLYSIVFCIFLPNFIKMLHRKSQFQMLFIQSILGLLGIDLTLNVLIDGCEKVALGSCLWLVNIYDINNIIHNVIVTFVVFVVFFCLRTDRFQEHRSNLHSCDCHSTETRAADFTMQHLSGLILTLECGLCSCNNFHAE